MTIYAVDNIDDAVTATREFLLPFTVIRWLKLSLVVFLIGAGTNVPTSGFNAPSSGGQLPSEQLPDAGLPTALSDGVLIFAGLVLISIVLIALVWEFISSTMEFIFVESLRQGDVTIQRYWSDRWRQGVRLLAFRIAIVVPLVLLFIGWIAIFLTPLIMGGSPPVTYEIGVLLGLPLLLLAGLTVALIGGFTTLFVVPIMILEDSGVLAGWKRLWPSIKAEWIQYLAYAFFHVIMAFALGMLAALVSVVILFVVLLVFLVFGGLLYVTGIFPSTIGYVLVGLLALGFVVVAITVSLFVQIPVLAYLRYYALLVLGDVEESLDLIPEQRMSIRADN